MARLLADTKERIEKRLESDYDLDKRIEAETLPKLAREHGATTLVEKVRRLQKEREEAEEALGKLGFDCSEYSGNLSLGEKAPKELRQALEDAQKAARKERDAELLKYDKAILKVWAAEDALEAREIVEELL
jgi:uncharacterized membrane protein